MRSVGARALDGFFLDEIGERDGLFPGAVVEASVHTNSVFRYADDRRPLGSVPVGALCVQRRRGKKDQG